MPLSHQFSRLVDWIGVGVSLGDPQAPINTSNNCQRKLSSGCLIVIRIRVEKPLTALVEKEATCGKLWKVNFRRSVFQLSVVCRWTSVFTSMRGKRYLRSHGPDSRSTSNTIHRKSSHSAERWPDLDLWPINTHLDLKRQTLNSIILKRPKPAIRSNTLP